MFLSGAHLAPRPSKAELREHRFQLFGDSTPRTQTPAGSQERKLMAHLGQQRVDPSRHFVDHGFLVLLKSNETVERITRESPMSARGTHAIEQAGVSPTLYTCRASADQAGRFGGAEKLGHEP